MTLELIIALPVWLIALVATIEFGLLLANAQQVTLASRVGGLEASETNPLPNTGDVPLNIRLAIDHQLQSAGLQRCHIFLQHNVNGPAVTLESSSVPGCSCSAPDPAELPFPTEAEYVRVTVCVEMAELTPNLLNGFGLDISNKVVRRTSTFRHEGP